MARLVAGDSLLLVVDVQARLAPAVGGHERMIARAGALLDAAKLLGVPALATEHVPEGIGPTVAVLRERLPADAIVRKTRFSCADEPDALARINALGRSQVLVCGMEAHVCVMQSALGLAERGFDVFLARDACGSRRDEDRDTAIARMARDGVRVTTAECAMFEWMHRADRPEWRDLLRIVKAL
jgi:nicotinamidase-related amidase